jgi:hypothetical protein
MANPRKTMFPVMFAGEDPPECQDADGVDQSRGDRQLCALMSASSAVLLMAANFW